MSTVESIMTKKVLVARKDAPINEIINTFIKSKIHHMPIINSKGALRAIISANDILEAIHEMDQFAMNFNGFSLERRIETKDEMTSDVISISKEDSINNAIDIMVTNNIHSLPIVENEMIIGILTPIDILKAVQDGRVSIK